MSNHDSGETLDAARTEEDAETAPVELESELREALRQVVDPEIGFDVVTLGLIRGIDVSPESVEIQMIFTTPFCPYGGILLQQVKDMARTLTERDITVELLDEQWSPDMMEGGDWSEWGLI